MSKDKWLEIKEKLSYVFIVIIFVLFAFKMDNGDNKASLFSNLLKGYIEETSAYIETNGNQLADIGSLLAFNSQAPYEEDYGSDILDYNIGDQSLSAYNPAEANYIEVGRFISNRVSEYAVQQGDLLSFIASDYGVSINSIIWANNLRNSDSISPGQVLKIPPVSGVIHQIKSGDTIASIAKKYNANEGRIIEFNGLSKNAEISIGEQIIVPDGEIKSMIKAGTTIASANKPFAYLANLGDYFMLPTNGYNWGRIHGRNGVDIANSRGTPIYAAAEGSVAISDGVGYNGGFGQYIKIIHPNGTETLYAHGSKLLVSAGDYVQRGQLIMLMGSTGRSTGNHLHFEVHGARNPLAKY